MYAIQDIQMCMYDIHTCIYDIQDIQPCMYDIHTCIYGIQDIQPCIYDLQNIQPCMYDIQMCMYDTQMCMYVYPASPSPILPSFSIPAHEHRARPQCCITCTSAEALLESAPPGRHQNHQKGFSETSMSHQSQIWQMEKSPKCLFVKGKYKIIHPSGSCAGKKGNVCLTEGKENHLGTTVIPKEPIPQQIQIPSCPAGGRGAQRLQPGSSDCTQSP